MGFTFLPADPPAFSAWAALARRPDERFSPPGELACVGLGEPCVWALLDGRRVGGAIAGPGLLSHPFVIPPYADFPALIAALTEYVRALTPEGAVPVYAGAPLREMEALARAGWRPGREPGDGMVWCRAMARPTGSAEPDAFPPSPGKAEAQTERAEGQAERAEGPPLRRPRKADARAASLLLEAAYAGTDPVRPDRAAFREDYLGALDAMDAACRAASSLAYANGETTPEGVCLVALYAGRPILWDVAVAPAARGRGLATAMIRRALGALAGHHDVLTLFVRHDAPAARLYERLGFFAGEVTCDMVLA